MHRERQPPLRYRLPRTCRSRLRRVRIPAPEPLPGKAPDPVHTPGRHSMKDSSTLATHRSAAGEGTTDGPRSHSFWKSLPGVLTAVAAVVTAIGGIIAVLLQAGLIGGTGKTPAQP